MGGLLYSITKRARSLIESYENKSFSFAIGFLGLTVIALARNYLESALEDRQILGFFSLPVSSFLLFFNHFYLFWIGLFIWMVLVLSWISGEKIEKVGRVVEAAFVVILIPPLIDIVMSRGTGYRIIYLLEWEGVKSAYLVWDFLHEIPWMTWGQRVEIYLSVLGLVTYMLVKGKGLLKALAGFGGLYLVVTVFGGVPFLLMKVSVLIWQEQTELAVLKGGLASANRHYAFICLVYILVGGWILLKRFDKKAWQEIKDRFLSKETLGICLLAFAGISYGYFSYKGNYPFALSNFFNYLGGFSVIAAFSLTWLSIRCSSYFKKIEKPWLSFVLWLTALYLALNVGFVALLLQVGFTLICIGWRLSKLRTVFYLLLLVSSFCAGYSLFAQNSTFSTLWPWAKQFRNARGHYLAGREYFLRQKYPSAIHEYEAALMDGYEDYQLHLDLAQSHQFMGFMSDALEELENAMILNPRVPDAYLGMGSILHSEGESKEALKIFDLAIQRRVEPDKFYLAKARVQIEIGQLRGAESSLEKALLLAAPRVSYYELRGMLATKRGRLTEALRMYNQLLKLDPNSVVVHKELGFIYHNMGRYYEAKSEYEEALKVEPQNARVHNNLGVLLLDMGNLEDAARQFAEALRLNPRLAESYYNLGRLFEMRGMPKRAEYLYRRSLKVDSTYQLAREALRKLGDR